MQTRFTDEQLRDPALRESEAVLRKCVHCGFCTATCPTYVLLGDELDSPRGRIYLIKDMLENGRPASDVVVRHLDRCLSCLSCVTTCPSGVDYRRLIDHARRHAEATYRRPAADRGIRALLAAVMPYPRRFRIVLALARVVRPLRRWLPARLAAMLDLVPVRAPAAAAAAEAADAQAAAGKRVVVLTGCVQSVVGRSINDATIRVLRRAGFDVVPVGGCCGSIVHHLGREAQSQSLAAGLVAALDAVIADGPIALRAAARSSGTSGTCCRAGRRAPNPRRASRHSCATSANCWRNTACRPPSGARTGRRRACASPITRPVRCSTA